MDGLLLVNKPVGITSFDVIRKLRHITGERKIGHAGTLDPLAEGLMLLLFGGATKQASRFIKLDKTYRAEITLGAISTTGDAEGVITPTPGVDQINYPRGSEVQRVLGHFVGQIKQVPPVYSAVKVAGKEAYKLARKGQVPEMPERTVTIHELRITNYDYPRLQIETKVSSGTYIRSLAQDIGDKLGTGAYLSRLVRTQVGSYRLVEAIDLDAKKTKLVQTLQQVEKPEVG